MTVKTFTAEEIDAYLGRQYESVVGQVIDQINNWLVRGDTVAVYENADLGHPEIGQCRLASYGSDAAMLTQAQFPEGPPQRLPDTPSMINWRYYLAGTYTGSPLS